MKFKYNKNILIAISLFIVFSLIVIFTYNNAFLYNETIAKVKSEKVLSEKNVTDVFGYTEKMCTQELDLVILNGKYKNQKYSIQNSYSVSQSLDNKYSKGDQLFVKVETLDSGQIKNVLIIDLKRDAVIVFCFFTFIFVLYLISRKKSVFITISLILNIAICLLITFLYTKNINIVFLSIVASIFFIIFTLFFINGYNKKSMISVCSTVVGVALSCFITFAVINLMGEDTVFFEQMEFVLKDVKQLFYIQIIIGNVGGIMDIAVSMSSSINELIEINPNISRNDLMKSAKIIGGDIMGTMSATILFAYISGSFPMIILLFKNGYNLSYVLEYCLNIEIVRAITGCIGMVLTIPVATHLSIKFLRKKGDKVEC